MAVNEMQSLTLNDARYDSFVDQTAREMAKAFYVNVEFDSETGKYIADKTAAEIGTAHRSGKPVYCHLIPNTGGSVYLTLNSEPVSDAVYTFSGVTSSKATMVSIDPTSIHVYTTEIPTAFYITAEISEDGATYAVDKTTTEIGAAFHSGKPVYCYLIADEVSMYLPLVKEIRENETYRFAGTNGNLTAVVVTYSDGTVNVNIARTPTSLPNPHKLTLTGAVSAEYDGSKAVSVEIPQGGTGGAKKWDLLGEYTFAEDAPVAAITLTELPNYTEFMVYFEGTCTTAATGDISFFINDVRVCGFSSIDYLYSRAHLYIQDRWHCDCTERRTAQALAVTVFSDNYRAVDLTDAAVSLRIQNWYGASSFKNGTVVIYGAK